MVFLGVLDLAKRLLLKKIFKELSKECTVIYLEQDSYCIDRSYLSLDESEIFNYDHPDAIDFSLLTDHITQLKSNVAVRVPEYDFRTHTRKLNTTLTDPARIIILEGIFIFFRLELLELIDYRIFIETSDDIRFLRRLQEIVINEVGMLRW